MMAVNIRKRIKTGFRKGTSDYCIETGIINDKSTYYTGIKKGMKFLHPFLGSTC